MNSKEVRLPVPAKVQEAQAPFAASPVEPGLSRRVQGLDCPGARLLTRRPNSPAPPSIPGVPHQGGQGRSKRWPAPRAPRPGQNQRPVRPRARLGPRKGVDARFTPPRLFWAFRSQCSAVALSIIGRTEAAASSHVD